MKKLADHCGEQLALLADREPRLRVLDGDLADSDGASHFAARHPHRFLMAGIAEQSMVSVAAGMASAGLQPWVFSFAAFLCYRAYDQIRVSVSQTQQPVVLVGSHAGGLSGRNGKTHCALNDLALMLSLPGVQVWSPGDFDDVAFAVQALVRDPRPAYLRCARTPLSEFAALPGEPAPHRWLRAKQRVSLISTGIASSWALAAAERLARQGLHGGVLLCLILAPAPPLDQLLADVDQLFVIEDHYTFGGLATLVRELGLAAPVRAFGWPRDWSGKSAADEEMLDRYELSGDALARSILATLRRDAREFGDTGAVNHRNVV
jgi:transketolase